MSSEQPESDVQDPGSRASGAGSTQRVPGIGDGDASPGDAPEAGEVPEHGDRGTAAGSPAGGLELDEPADGPGTGHS